MEALERLCRAKRLPLTMQRRVIYEAVMSRHDHPTAEDIYVTVRRRLPSLSRATAYRVLETLVRLGVIGKTSHPGSVARFDNSTERHHHLVCNQCEETTDLGDDLLKAVTLPDTRRLGFRIEDYSIHFKGLCSKCRSSLERGPRDVAGRKRVSRRRRPADRGSRLSGR